MILDTILADTHGHIRIWEKETGKVLLDQNNAIHPENMSIALAKSLAGKPQGNIKELVFGNGGAKLDSNGNLIYSPVNVIGRSASLYNQTYSKIVGSDSTDMDNNFMEVTHANGNIYSDISITCTLNQNEPTGQDILNDTTSVTTGDYTFSELGLKTNEGSLITHCVFYPVNKASNISLVINYMVRIKIV